MVSGGIIGLFLPNLQSFIGGTVWSIYFPLILLSASVVLFFVAVDYSTRSEGMPMVYQVVIAPENFSSICDSLESELGKQDPDKIRVTVEGVRAVRHLFDNRDELRSTGIDILRKESNKVIDGINFPLSDMQTSLVQKLGQYVKFLEQTQNLLINGLKESCSNYSSDYSTTKKKSGIILRKKRFGRIRNLVLEMTVELNVKHSILCPAYCIITMFPRNFQDYLSKLQLCHDLTGRMRWDKQLSQLGVRFIPSDEFEFWEKFHHEIAFHLDKKQAELLEELKDVQDSVLLRLGVSNAQLKDVQDSILKRFDELDTLKQGRKKNVGAA